MTDEVIKKLDRIIDLLANIEVNVQNIKSKEFNYI